MQIDAKTHPTTPMSVIIRPLGGLENPINRALISQGSEVELDEVPGEGGFVSLRSLRIRRR